MTIDQSILPKHIAIIMDGNRRWAKNKGLSPSAGHVEGAKVFEKIAFDAFDLGIRYFTVYAFSTENWKRPKEEIATIEALFLEYIKRAREKFFDKDIRLRFIGDMSRFNEKLRREIDRIEKDTAQRRQMTIGICANYGARAEIVNAARGAAQKVLSGELGEGDITDEVISSFLYTGGMPEPDLIIRPGGERRLSNFLLWQAAYSELWFGDVLWPDFTKEDLIAAICDYQKRVRRYGGC